MISNYSTPAPFTITLNYTLKPLFTPATSQVALQAIPGFVRKGSLGIDTDTLDDIETLDTCSPITESVSQ